MSETSETGNTRETIETHETSDSGETSGARIVAIGNQKGGAGKTTMAVHLAGALNARGDDVLVLDMDKQGGLTNAFGYDDQYYDVDRESFFELLMDVSRAEKINEQIVAGDEFDLVPSTEKFMAQSNLGQLAEAGRSRERLQLVIDAIEHDYDWILIDTTPDLNVLTDNAVVAAGNLLVPFFPEKLNQNSLRLLLKQLQGLGQLYPSIGNPNDTVLAFVPSRVESVSEHERVIDEVRDGFDIPVFEVRKRTALSNAISNGGTIFEHGDDSDRLEGTRETFDEIADHLEVHVG